MMRRRAMLLKADSGRLPSEYYEVEYLESTGTQYIITGLPYLRNDIVNIDIMPMSTDTDKCVFGAYDNGNNKCEMSFFSGRFRFDLAFYGSSYVVGTKYKITKDGSTWYVDNTQESGTGKNENTSHNLYLFGRYYNGNANKLSKIRIYSYTLIRNNVDLINLVPCIRISDNKPGMYDLIGNTFYTNQGTGEFLTP